MGIERQMKENASISQENERVSKKAHFHGKEHHLQLPEKDKQGLVTHSISKESRLKPNMEEIRHSLDMPRLALPANNPGRAPLRRNTASGGPGDCFYPLQAAFASDGAPPTSRPPCARHGKKQAGCNLVSHLHQDETIKP